MVTKLFEVVGKSTVKSKIADRSYDIVHLIGEPFYDSHVGKLVCTSFVDCGRYEIGEVVSVMFHKGDYIIIN